MKLRWLVLLIFFALLTPAQAEVVSKIAAVVNNEIITTHQLDLKLAEALASRAQGQIIPQEQMAELRRQFLDQLIEEELVQQKIKALNLTASEDEIEAAINDIQRQNQLTREQLIDALKSQGLPFERYREKMREQILRFKLIGREVQSKVDVIDQDVRDYFNAHLDDYRQHPLIELDQLRIPLPDKASPSQIASARKEAEQALLKLRNGASLETVIAETKGATGGSPGSFKEQELSPQIRDALAGKQAGEFSEVVESPAGLMIFQIVRQVPGSLRNFDDVKLEIRQLLAEQDREERFKTWTRELRKEAYIDIRI